ncbi:HEPN domain-containing protein [Streptococcus mitis]|uniref:HEPN domain-containing protein n=1 Tax=Streptococcus mitis TaxID=28037 RepID=UPI0021B7FCC4|nr:HEPN domain-containing protein [Streptococcus mitis]
MNHITLDKTSILNTYDEYKNVYNNSLGSLEGNAKILLENSLYLSIFTTFELFLKDIIDIYIRKALADEICFSKLVDSFAIEYLKNKERQFDNFFKDQNLDSFNNIKSLLENKLSEKDLRIYVRFEFLHKKKLDKYYPALMEQILGIRNFLESVDIEFPDTDSATLGVELREVKNAKEFLSIYTEKIRNSIAHENSHFSVGNISFDKCVESFKDITNKIYDQFISYNDLQDTERLSDIMRDNILAQE